MSDWDEKAEDYAVAHHTYEYLTPDENAYYTSGFVRGARWQREALVDLRWENRQLEAGAEGVVSLDGLRVAWETAEVPTEDTPIREGDVVIVRHGGGFAVEPADRILSGQTHGRERILSRAPQREPWEALADVLEGVLDADARCAESIARDLHERGVRVVGGDEK